MQRIRRFQPQLSPWYTPRPRLLRQLHLAGQFTLTVVTGPGGAGKTSLLSDWSSQQQGPLVWLTLDESDRGLEPFLVACIGAIHARFPDRLNGTLSLINNGAVDSPRFYAATIADELSAIDEPAFLVLDDFHLAECPEVDEFLEAFVALPPRHVHLVLGSRQSLTLSTSGHRSHGRMLEISPHQMVFTESEAAGFLTRASQSPLPPEDVAHFVRAAGGWAVGLHAIALALFQLSDGADVADVLDQASKDTVAFISSDVLERLPAGMGDLMMRVAIPPRISPELAVVLAEGVLEAEDTRRLWDQAVESGVFLTQLGAGGQWYHLHRLFRDAALVRLQASVGEQAYRRLHGVASRWFLAQGDVETAFGLALNSDRPALAVDIASRNAQQAIAQDRWLQVAHWIEQLDSRDKSLPLDLLAAHAMVQQVRGRYPHMVDTIGVLKQRLSRERRSIPSALHDQYAADITVLTLFANADDLSLDERTAQLRQAHRVLADSGRFTELFAIFLTGSFLSLRDPEAAATFVGDIIDEYQTQTDVFSRLRVAWALSARSQVVWNSGNPHEAVESSRQALVIARQAGAYRLVAQSDHTIGMALLEMNDLDGAERYLRSVMANPSSGGLVLSGAVVRLAMTLQALGREHEADAVLEAHADRLLETEQVDNSYILRSCVARIAYLRGNFTQALSLVESMPSDLDQVDIRSLDIPGLLKALLLIERGTPSDLAEAETLLNEIDHVLGNFHTTRFNMQIDMTRALLDRGRGQQTRAERRAQSVLLRAERCGMVRSLLDMGSAVVPLLTAVADTSSFARELLRTLSPGANNPKVVQLETWTARLTDVGSDSTPVYIEPLTEREIEILYCLHRRLSNKEIAYELSISPLTVKTHARNLYAKLGVNSRRQAIARALALGILSAGDDATSIMYRAPMM